jgi:hypothetical protein
MRREYFSVEAEKRMRPCDVANEVLAEVVLAELTGDEETPEAGLREAWSHGSRRGARTGRSTASRPSARERRGRRGTSGEQVHATALRVAHELRIAILVANVNRCSDPLNLDADEVIAWRVVCEFALVIG